MITEPEIDAIAREVLTSLSSHSQIPPFSSRPGGLTLTQAYSVTPMLRAACTYSVCRSASVLPRTRRANTGTLNTAIA